MLKKELPDAFENDDYLEASDKIRQAYKTKRDDLIGELRELVGADGLTVVRTSSGLSIFPKKLKKGEKVGINTLN